ncbi:MAG: (deoxy)nucleoside triphosphate pyrophosphohydrolase [Planctomycetaceae bacterium]|nr:(deoxy)nucleoside triphosphate pyrophosphohydrolase [Planctomycetaceae bacterium]
MSPPVRVGIGVVEADGKYLIGIRPPDTVLPGMAEFPGGKCESDETPRACVVRECREETGLIVLPTLHLATINHEYEHGPVELHFWRCCLANGSPSSSSPRPPFRWAEKAELTGLTFPEANGPILDMLQQDSEAAGD